MAAGTITRLVFCLCFLAVYLLFYNRAKQGAEVRIRRIPGLDAIDEAVGRCTEMGKPVHYTFGRGDFDSSVLASFAILSYTASKCASNGTTLIVTNSRPEVHALTEEIVATAYKTAGQPDAYKPDNIRFFSDLVSAYAAGIYGVFMREKPGANIMLGNLYGESMLLGEVGHQIGAVQIGGSVQTPQVPFLVATCDYTLIGDELFAAGAHISQDPAQVGSIAAQDFGKWVAIATILLGTVLGTAGNDVILSILQR